MRIIALINQKGGVGKTTTAVNLAAALGLAGKQTVLMDLDPQACATRWLGVETGNPGLLEALTEGHALSYLLAETEIPNLSMIPGSLSLSGAERRLAGEVGTEFLLRGLVKNLTGFDYLLIDCPPSLGLLTVNALTAGHEALVPVMPHFLALNGLEMLFKTLAVVRDRLNPGLRVTGILPVRVDRRTKLTEEVISYLRETYGEQLLATSIRENVRLAEAPNKKRPIQTHDSRSTGAADYRALAEEIIAQEEKLS